VLYKPVAAQSAARSCAAKESAARQARADAAQPVALVPTHGMEQEMKLEMEPAVKHQTQKPEARLAQTAPRAAQAVLKPPEAQTPASQSVKELRTEA
jgi:hypothetical protein